MSFYKKTIFWTNLRNSLVALTGGTPIIIHEMGGADAWMWVGAGIGIAATWISIWITDKDNDGVVDMFQ
jgi:hypothetical protein